MRLRVDSLAAALLTFAICGASGCLCKGKEAPKDDPNQRATSEGRATSLEVLTRVGVARVLNERSAGGVLLVYWETRDPR